MLTTQTLSESAKIVGVNIKTLSKHLDVESAVNSEFTALVKDHKIKRIRVYFKSNIIYISLVITSKFDRAKLTDRNWWKDTT